MGGEVSKNIIKIKMKKIKCCDLCGNKEFEFLFTNHDRYYRIPGIYHLNRCKKCGLIFINPQPNDKELSKHYPQEKYYSLKAKFPRKLKIKLYETYFSKKGNFFSKLLFLPLKHLLRTIKVVKGGKFLDVGCGSGEFLIIMKLLGMDSYGVEPGKFDKKFIKENNLKVSEGTLNKIKYPPEFFDVITLNHVFEHVNNPTETMNELYKITKRGGTVIISVPQSNSLMYKLFKQYWVNLDSPRHLYIYSPKTLKQYAEKVGFKVKKIRYTSGYAQFVATYAYFTNRYRKKEIYLSDKSFIFSPFLRILFTPLALIFNLLKIGDAVDFELEKPTK
jgi:2-polyprenyl-3-methyl-5-hydroxy-6-metoxy-1,4-benzoquinol methylase